METSSRVKEFLRLWWEGLILLLAVMFVGLLFQLGGYGLDFLIGWLPNLAQQIIGWILFLSLYPVFLFMAYEEIRKKMMKFIT